MFQYQKKIKELGIEAKLTKKIKEKISGFDAFVAESNDSINAAKEQLSTQTDAQIQKNIQNDIREMEADIVKEDEFLTAEIVKFNVALPGMEERTRKMMEGRQAAQAKKKGNTPAPAPQQTAAPVVEEPIVAPVVEETPDLQPEIVVPVVEETPVEVVPEENKKGGFGTVLAIIGVGIAAVLGFKAYQNR